VTGIHIFRLGTKQCPPDVIPNPAQFRWHTMSSKSVLFGIRSLSGYWWPTVVDWNFICAIMQLHIM